MSNMYDIIAKICNERGIKVGKMCSDTGLSRGLISDLKMGRTKELSAKNTKKIADYFGVSTDYLLGNEQQEEKSITDDDIKFALFGKTNIDDATYESVKKFAKFAAEQMKKEGDN